MRYVAGISAIALLALAPAAFGQAKKAAPAAKPAASTLERVKSSGTLKLGYRTDARATAARAVYLRAVMMKLPNDTPSVWPLPVPLSASEIEPLVTTCAFDASPAPASASAVA